MRSCLDSESNKHTHTQNTAAGAGPGTATGLRCYREAQARRCNGRGLVRVTHTNWSVVPRSTKKCCDTGSGCVLPRSGPGLGPCRCWCGSCAVASLSCSCCVVVLRFAWNPCVLSALRACVVLLVCSLCRVQRCLLCVPCAADAGLAPVLLLPGFWGLGAHLYFGVVC